MFYNDIGGVKVSALGFGCMRFPVKDGRIDEPEAERMLMRAYESGVNYFDTAYNYHDMQSEPFVGKTLAKLPRDTYRVATKFPSWKPETIDEAKEIFEFQMKNLCTDRIDFYLIHALTRERWDKVKSLGIVELLEGYQREGRIVKLGFSFHDSYEVFDEIINFRKWDFCQIQFNYMDTEHQAGLRGIELAKRLGTGIVVMEPVKGGMLASLPEDVSAPLRALSPATDAAWALRYVAGTDNVRVTLSGMSTMEQVEDNLSTFTAASPLSEVEAKAVDTVAATLRARCNNGCTGCNYCVPCPNGVMIPRVFRVWNEFARYQHEDDAREDYGYIPAEGRADKCIACGRCEGMCPQHISIIDDLKKVAQLGWDK